MARIAGVDLPRNKRIAISLTYIFGIGNTSAVAICGKADVELSTKTDHLSESEIIKLREIIENFGKDEGYTLILGRGTPGVLYTREALDVTDRIIENYNQKS